ncbi:MAG: hypothetical protein J0I12_13530 [Candidatus Eremiobacteraeota bacterium]|nr:hypothetical protein [Candidatus Eremiobacteraeota bacterium]
MIKKEHRICALCKNLEVLDQGREFPGIADTEYIKYRCKIFGWSNREDYLMDSEPAEKFAKQEPFDCERFEGWSPE